MSNRLAVVLLLLTAPAAGAQDIVVLTDAGPLLVCLRLEVDGKAPAEVHGKALKDYVAALFGHLDRDGNGSLTEAEARNAPPPMIALPGGGEDSVYVAFNFRALDADGDAKVTREELADYYRHFDGGAFIHTNRFPPQSPASPRQFSQALHGELLRALGGEAGGKLSLARLKEATRALARLDRDENELITPAEAAPALPLPGPQINFAPGTMRTFPMGSSQPEVLVLDAGESAKSLALARALLARYGAPSTPKLSRERLGIGAALFARLDRDKDGGLNSDELAVFADRPADVELRVRLGKRKQGEAALEEVRSGGEGVPVKLLQEKGGPAVLLVGGFRLELSCDQSRLTDRALARMRQTYLREFQAADADGDGRLERREAARGLFFRNVFGLLDSDGDDRVGRAELEKYLEAVMLPQARALAARSSLLISGKGLGLWDLLDRDRDDALGLRELRAAPSLLASLDRDGDGSLEASEIPATYQLVIGPGRAGFKRLSGEAVVVVSDSGRLAYPPDNVGGGPVWFRKMDRNGDGDVSPREFLGTAEQLKKLDRDGDGLINRAEAERAESLRR